MMRSLDASGDVLRHSKEGDARAARCRVFEALDDFIAAGAIEWFSGERGDKLAAAKAFSRGRCFAERKDEAADAAARPTGMRVHGAHARGVCVRIEQGCVASARVIAAEQGCPPAPAAATDDGFAIEDGVIGPIVDQLRVEAHDLERSL